MLAGIAAGRLFASHVPAKPLARLVFGAIIFLLFLLGIQIGANDALFARLPEIGATAACLTLACMAGSIIVVRLVAGWLARRGLKLYGKLHIHD